MSYLPIEIDFVITEAKKRGADVAGIKVGVGMTGIYHIIDSKGENIPSSWIAKDSDFLKAAAVRAREIVKNRGVRLFFKASGEIEEW